MAAAVGDSLPGSVRPWERAILIRLRYRQQRPAVEAVRRAIKQPPELGAPGAEGNDQIDADVGALSVARYSTVTDLARFLG
jgi:hypothetical protein